MSRPGTYDTVVIGSGLGGLLSAVILAKEGRKVCVLEKNKQIGGCLQTFSLRKKVFDSCVHYIGGLGEEHTLNQIFRYAGIMDKLQLRALDPGGFDRIALGEDPELFPLAVGKDRFVEQLMPYFPGAQADLQRYLDTVSQVSARFPLYHLRPGSAGEKAAVTGLELEETLRSIVADPKLRKVLTGNSLLYDGVPGKTPFYLHALVCESYMHSAHKVVPGSSQIAKYLWQELRNLGGMICRNTEVTRLAEEDGRIHYAETEDGARFYARDFISNVHPAVLLRLVQSNMFRPAFRQRIGSLGQTRSPFMVNIVPEPGKVLYRPYNLYWQAAEVQAVPDSGRLPDSYALYFTEDPDHPGYSESVSVLTYMDYRAMLTWEHSLNHSGRPGERGDGYSEAKQAFAERLLDLVCQRVPDLKGNILAQKEASPLTFRDYTHTPQGALYGIQKDVRNPAHTTLSTRTRIPNLLQTGQNINLHGVLGVSITAVATCSELLGMDYLLDKINAANR